MFSRLKPVLHNQRRHHKEKPGNCNEEWTLFATTTESLHEVVKTHHNQKKKERKEEELRVL